MAFHRHFKQENIPDLNGRVAIVTGGSDGVGYYDALGLARAGAKVIIVSTTHSWHGKQAEADINKVLIEDHSTGSVIWHGIDMSNLKVVDDLAQTILKEEHRLDLLICNAGIGQVPYGISIDGVERHFEVNDLAHYVLVLRLLPLMQKTTAMAPLFSVRIIMQSSESHRMAPASTKFISKEEINENLDASQIDGRTKLGLICFARQLVKRKLSFDSGSRGFVLTMSVHPGSVETEVVKPRPRSRSRAWSESNPAMGKVLKLFAPRNMTLAEGAEASLWAATCPDINVSNWHEYQGNYYAHAYGKSGSESELAKDIEVARNYWNLCSTLTKEALGQELS